MYHFDTPLLKYLTLASNGKAGEFDFAFFVTVTTVT